MNPMNNAWTLLKQMRPHLHHKIGLRNIRDKHKKEMNSARNQQLANAIQAITNRVPHRESSNDPIGDLERKQREEFKAAFHMPKPMPQYRTSSYGVPGSPYQEEGE